MRVGVSLPVREMENDLGAIKAYAQLAETLELSHLRVPDQVLRVGSGPLHEPMTLMAYLSGVTERIELVPSVIVLPSRQTALVAKQAAEIDNLSGGRLRLGIGVGGSEDEYRAMGVDFHTRGARCDEQLELLNLLWTRETVEFDGRFDQITGAGLNPLPVQRPIPIWIGARPVPGDSVIKRIDRYVELVAIGVLQMQEFASDATHVERYQSQIAAHTVFCMHDRGACLQIVERTNNGLWIAFRATTSNANA